jgi:uncharacterized protein (TIRG00374 family)
MSTAGSPHLTVPPRALAVADTRRVLRRHLWIPVSLALLGFVVWRTRPWELTEAHLDLDAVAIAAVIILNAVVIVLWAVRSRSLMAGVGHPLPLPALVPLVSFANTISNLTPASAGEVMRAVILRDRYGVPVVRSTAVILVERVWAIGIMAVTAGTAAVIAFARPTPAVAIALVVLAIGGCFVPAIAYRAGVRPGRLLERWSGARVETATLAGTEAGILAAAAPDPAARRPSRARRVARVLADLDRSMATLIGDRSRATVFVAATLGVFACYAVQLWSLLQMLGESVPLEAAWAALGLATLAGVVSALPFGLGAADAVMSLVLVALGVTPPAAGLTVLLLRATATLPLGVAGALSWAALARRTRPPGPRDGQVPGEVVESTPDPEAERSVVR